jgi:hypothetical protein
MQDGTASFDNPARRAFRLYLRTGQRDPAGGTEVKFNPYHDPRNGQFTFAPGGPGSLKHVLSSPRDYAPAPPGGPTGRGGRGRRLSNSGAFRDPMLLHQVFPGLQSPAGRSIIAAADYFFDLTGPASALTAELSLRRATALLGEIKRIDPQYRVRSRGMTNPETAQGWRTYLDGLRMDRAAALYHARGQTGPLQVETLRFLQTRVDAAYAQGLKALEAGKISTRPSDRLNLGNFVDRRVREELREMYNQFGVMFGKDLPVRVVGREYSTTQVDRTYSIPDSRVGRVAFDMTLERKTLGTPQVRNFFASDFKPDFVIIVRPSQLGPGSTYAIRRPRN